ncbi:MAG: type III pantothenate kinase, partial [Acidobacteria bacterium]|nr:type III pantothenate kinase [Acidobacteriota bacterium]
MLLTLDVGNTQTAVGLFDGETLVGHWRLTTNPDQTSDEMRLALRGVLSLGNFKSDDIHGVSISCVVPAILNPLREVAELVAPGAVTVVGPGTKTGMPITIDNPREVGADRVVNAVAARQKYGAPVVVVDFGTSTNFDVVGPNGDYLGGVIAAGLLPVFTADVLR